MRFLDMGPLEILLILVVALIIWGPAKIPEIARTLGRTMRALRKVTSDFTTAVIREANLKEKERPSQPRANSSDKTRESSDAAEEEPPNVEITGPRD